MKLTHFNGRFSFRSDGYSATTKASNPYGLAIDLLAIMTDAEIGALALVIADRLKATDPQEAR